MNLRKIIIIPALLAILAATGCSGLNLGAGSGGDSDTPSATSLSGGGRGGPTVSDSEITSSIQAAFKQDPELAAANIAITVNKGVVSLSGNLPNVQAYLRAGSLARNVLGVRPPVNVTNLLYPL